MEKLLSELLFEVEDLLAERWLGDKGAGGRLCKIACLSDCQEVTKLVELHR